MLIGDPLTLVPISWPSFPVGPEPLLRFFLWLPVASSLTRLLAALLMACLVPMMVPLPGLLLVTAIERAGDFPLGGRLALRAAAVSRDFEEELRALELLVDSVRAFDPLATRARELALLLTCPNLLVGDGEDGEVGAGVEVEVGTPSLGIDLLDLPLLPKLAPLFSLDSPGLDPTEVRLSDLSKDIRLP